MNEAGLCNPEKDNRRGIALLMVLWVLTILTVIVLSFAYMTKAETHASVSFRNQATKRFLAEAGIERGVMEMFYRRQNLQAAALEGVEVWRPDGTPYKVEMENGFCTVSVMDESGKINLNTLNDTSGIILKNLLMNSGVKEEVADTIVDSILDWKDPDDLVRLHGAESGYYSSLRTPYKAKDANFDSTEELLLVKGMTAEILHGDGKSKGILDFITVYSKIQAINLLAAPKEVLSAIPGLGDDDIENIINMRENQQYDPAAMQVVQGIIQKVKPPFNSFVNMGGESGTFTISSAGSRSGEKTGYGIKATVSLDYTGVPMPGNPAAGGLPTLDSKKAPYKFLGYRSPADVKHETGNKNGHND